MKPQETVPMNFKQVVLRWGRGILENVPLQYLFEICDLANLFDPCSVIEEYGLSIWFCCFCNLLNTLLCSTLQVPIPAPKQGIGENFGEQNLLS